MYLHLGKGKIVSTEDIVGIFDLDITSQSHLTRKYLTMAEKAGEVVNANQCVAVDSLNIAVGHCNHRAWGEDYRTDA